MLSNLFSGGPRSPISEMRKQEYVNSLYSTITQHKERKIVLQQFNVELATIKTKIGEQETERLIQLLLYEILLNRSIPHLNMLTRVWGEWQPVNINIEQKENRILSLCIKNQRWDFLDILISRGATLDVESVNNPEVLMHAIESGQIMFINAFLCNGNETAVLKKSLDLLHASARLTPTAIANVIKLFFNIHLRQGMMKELKDTYQDYTDEFTKALAVLNDKDRAFMQSLIDKNFTDSYKYLVPFGRGDGNITHEAGLLACAAIAEVKSTTDTPFNPTLLQGGYEESELEQYFQLIQDNLERLNNQRFNFILSGNHWICGVIEISDSKPTVFLVDSFGKKDLDAWTWSYSNPKQVAEVIFGKENIMCSNQIMQSRSSDCAGFAIEITRKFYKVPKMPDAAAGSFDLNTSMIRNIQSLQRIEEYILKHDEAELEAAPINKKGESFRQSLDRNLGGDSKKQNLRMVDKLTKLSEKVLKFVTGKADEDIQTAQQAFSLDAFKNRIKFKPDVRLPKRS